MIPVTSTAPPLPEDLTAVLKRMRLPYLRAAAPEVLATAKAQPWDPGEVLRVLLDEEVRGRDQATRTMRRKAAGLPSGKSFDSWREQDSSIPVATQSALATLEWVHRAENLAISGPSGSGKMHCCQRPVGTAHWRPVEVPAGGQRNCPFAARSSAHRVVVDPAA